MPAHPHLMPGQVIVGDERSMGCGTLLRDRDGHIFVLTSERIVARLASPAAWVFAPEPAREGDGADGSGWVAYLATPFAPDAETVRAIHEEAPLAEAFEAASLEELLAWPAERQERVARLLVREFERWTRGDLALLRVHAGPTTDGVPTARLASPRDTERSVAPEGVGTLLLHPRPSPWWSNLCPNEVRRAPLVGAPPGWWELRQGEAPRNEPLVVGHLGSGLFDRSGRLCGVLARPGQEPPPWEASSADDPRPRSRELIGELRAAAGRGPAEWLPYVAALDALWRPHRAGVGIDVNVARLEDIHAFLEEHGLDVPRSAEVRARRHSW